MFDNFNFEKFFSLKKRYFGLAVCAVAVILILIAVSGYLFLAQRKLAKTNNDHLVYQAVFLSNGQVYFGNAENINRQYIELTDVYYLQVKDALGAGQKESADGSDLSLVKLGSELHGPEDKMYINRDQVLFIEDLKEDSKVMQAIREYYETIPT